MNIYRDPLSIALIVTRVACNGRGPGEWQPSKGRPAARAASPCPPRAAGRERGEGAKRHRGVSHHNPRSTARTGDASAVVSFSGRAISS